MLFLFVNAVARQMRLVISRPHGIAPVRARKLLAALGIALLLGCFLPHHAQAQTTDPTNPSSSSSDRQSDSRNNDNNGEGNARRNGVPSEPNTAISPPTAFKQVEFGTTQSGENQSGNSAAASPLIKPPAPPNEFELYLRSVAGHDVKRFGYDLLLPADRDLALPANATIPPDYPVNVGDTISVNIIGSIEGSANFVVDTNGKIFLPKIGEVSVVGVQNRDLHDVISRAIGTQYRGYQVAVSLVKLRGIHVFVTGFANNPGAYTVNSLSTLVNAVLAAGGPSAGGSFRTIQLYRNGKLVTNFDLYDFLRGGDRSHDAILQNEDVLFIPPVGPQVAVVGSVNQEAIYEALPGETIAQLLHYAGGVNALADPSRVVLYRLSDKETVGSREIAHNAEATVSVVAGDIVQVLSKGSLIHPLEQQAVTVRIEGEVTRPGNYFVPPDTSLATVMQMAGGLTPRAFPYGTRLSRESVREQQRASYRDAIDQMETTLAGAALTGDNAINGGDRASQIAAARAVLARLRTAEPDGRMVLSIPYGSSTLPGDLILENNDRIVVPPLVRTVGVFGAVYRPASFLLPNGQPARVKDYLERAGGTTRIADRGNIFVVRANGEVLTRKHGALNARVQPGDVVFVPVKTKSSSLLSKIASISSILFQFGISAAALAAIQ